MMTDNLTDEKEIQRLKKVSNPPQKQIITKNNTLSRAIGEVPNSQD